VQRIAICVIVTGGQGDQIGRIFAYWAVVFIGQFFTIIKVAKICGLLFPVVQFIVKNELGYILGDFFPELVWSPCRRTHFLSGANKISKPWASFLADISISLSWLRAVPLVTRNIQFTVHLRSEIHRKS
jgi:hypothetical protein